MSSMPGSSPIGDLPRSGDSSRNWHATYSEWLRDPPFKNAAHGIGREQTALRRALWKSGLSLYILGPEFNYRTPFPGRVVGPVKILHGRSSNNEALLERLNAHIGPRCFPPLTAP